MKSVKIDDRKNQSTNQIYKLIKLVVIEWHRSINDQLITTEKLFIDDYWLMAQQPQTDIMHRHHATCTINPLSFLGSPVDEFGKTIGPMHHSVTMLQNKLSRDTNNAVGLPKQRSSYQSSPTFLCFKSPTVLFPSQHNLVYTMWPAHAKCQF